MGSEKSEFMDEKVAHEDAVTARFVYIRDEIKSNTYL